MTTFNNLSLLAAGTTICANCTGIMVFPQTGIIRELTGEEATGDCYSRKPVKPGTPVLVGGYYDCSNGMFISYQFTNKVESGYITGYSNLNIQYVSVSDNGCQNWGRYKVYGVKFLETGESASSRRISSSDGKLYLVRDYSLTQIAGGDYVGTANQVLANINIRNICAATGEVVDGGGGNGSGGGGVACSECGGTAELVGAGPVGTVCIGVPSFFTNKSTIVPNNFGCTYRPIGDPDASVMVYPTSSCGSAIPGSSFTGVCGSLAGIGKIFYKAIVGGVHKSIIPGKTFEQCGIGQGIHTYYAILCPNSCAEVPWPGFGTVQALKTKSYPSTLQVN